MPFYTWRFLLNKSLILLFKKLIKALDLDLAQEYFRSFVIGSDIIYKFYSNAFRYGKNLIQTYSTVQLLTCNVQGNYFLCFVYFSNRILKEIIS